MLRFGCENRLCSLHPQSTQVSFAPEFQCCYFCESSCLFYLSFNIEIKHGFPCINVCQVPREMLKTEAVERGFQHLTRDLANVNVLVNNV